MPFLTTFSPGSRRAASGLTPSTRPGLDDKKDAASDERFSVALAAWAEMEQSLRAVYGYEGCIQGPDQQCPQDVLVTCDLCVG